MYSGVLRCAHVYLWFIFDLIVLLKYANLVFFVLNRYRTSFVSNYFTSEQYLSLFKAPLSHYRYYSRWDCLIQTAIRPTLYSWWEDTFFVCLFVCFCFVPGINIFLICILQTFCWWFEIKLTFKWYYSMHRGPNNDFYYRTWSFANQHEY